MRDAEDAAGFLSARLVGEERFLYRLLLCERVAVPLALLVAIGGGGERGRALVAAIALCVWTAATTPLAWHRLSLLQKRPGILALEQAAGAAVFLGAGSWRGVYFYSLAEASVFAAAFVGLGLALVLA